MNTDSVRYKVCPMKFTCYHKFYVRNVKHWTADMYPWHSRRFVELFRFYPSSRTEKYFFDSFQIERNMMVVTVFLFVMY